MATQQEINQILGVWAANFLLLLTQRQFLNPKTNNDLNAWFNKYVKTLITQTGTATISLPTESKTERCGKPDPRVRHFKSTALSSSYGNKIIAQLRQLRADLPGILNSLSISNGAQIIAEFDKIVIRLHGDVGCKTGK